MQWALHDPKHGYYGSGRARIGPGGDFATSPSLGSEFSALLLPQLIEWLEQLPSERLSLLEAGPGEGQLASQLALELVQLRPDLAARTELVLLEPNPGMAVLQQQSLQGVPLSVRWTDWDALHLAPVTGVVVAHEVLDALPVERVLWDGASWRWQHVAIDAGSLCLVAGPVLTPQDWDRIPALDSSAGGREPGWCTEVHLGLGTWFQACAAALREGVLLVMDYALEARRYYAASRPDGTLMAYRDQQAMADPLQEPGSWDLTAHLCLEAVRAAALGAGWTVLGERRQGEALLALGLADRFAALGESCAGNLPEGLRRREQLLRLVDPLATGDFRWLVFGRPRPGGLVPSLTSRCLQDPPPLG
jgi:SAM-dependent MidA family methyltransferase